MIGQLLTGRYLILEELGAGGFSETYLARDKYLPHHPLCVVKCFKLAARNTISLKNAQELFETEGRILEQLGRHHTQIPTLLAYCREANQSDIAEQQENDESGTQPALISSNTPATPQMYMVQEYIEGENLGEWFAQGQRLTQTTAIALLAELLSVLGYIHSYGIVHRDIKPNNVIWRRWDGRLVLIDFGAACLVSETESGVESADETSTLAVGTPGYMPDEQHLGITQFNSDLYALGILVIHLLTGVHPRQFQQDLVSGELDWQQYLPRQSFDPKLIEILNRMVRSNFRDRYQRTADVLADLQALPIPDRFRQQAANSKWRKLLRKLVIPATAALLVGVVGARYVQAYSKQPGNPLGQLGQLFGHIDVEVTLLHDVPISAGVERMLISPNNQFLVIAGSDRKIYLWSLQKGTMFNSLSGHHSKITALGVSHDSQLLVSGSEDNSLRLWDTKSGALLRTFMGHQAPVTAVTISPDARIMVSGSRDGILHRWDLQTGKLLQTLKLPNPNSGVAAVAYGTKPHTLFSACSNRQVQVWDLQTGKLDRSFAGHTAEIVGLQIADDQTLVSLGKDRALAWDLDQEKLLQALPENSANPMSVSMNHHHFVTVHDDGSIRTWLHQTGEFIIKNEKGSEQNLLAALSPDHSYLVDWTSDQRLHIWKIRTTGN